MGTASVAPDGGCCADSVGVVQRVQVARPTPTLTQVQPSAHDVLHAISLTPQSVGEVGVAVAVAAGAARTSVDGQPVGQWLAAAGISLSGIQVILDTLVRDGTVIEARGRDLWALGLPTAGTKAQARYYVMPRPRA